MNTQPITSIRAITLSEIDGEPRALDVDIGESLGFERPRDIRKLIERHRGELETYGTCATVAHVIRGNATTEFWLSEEQALLLALVSEATKAPAVRAMLIRTFVDWRRGNLAPQNATRLRDVHITFRSFHSIARLVGFDANESALGANRATIKVTGFDALGAIGATHLLAERQEQLLTPTIIGKRLDGLSPQFVNKRLEALGYQEAGVDSHNAKVWHPTDKGEAFGRWFDTSKRHQDGTSVQQWKWFASIVPQLQAGTVVAIVAQAGAPAG